MKLHQHKNTVETNVQAVSTSFKIGNASKIIGFLRDKVYTNKVHSVAREIISNGRDAMREVGKGNGFEITVPTALNPVFEVRDFGPGISPDRMEDIFIAYGSSTKENSNEFTGGLGIGSKSPFSLVDSFSVVTFIDGVKRAYACEIGSSNEGQLTLISTTATKEATGKWDNSPGAVCEINRELVDDNPTNTCSTGLHVACFGYAKDFGEKLVEVKVNPADVVCVPIDYNNTKMRVCRFEVLAECTDMRDEPLYGHPKPADDEQEEEEYREDGQCGECESDNDSSANYCSNCGSDDLHSN